MSAIALEVADDPSTFTREAALDALEDLQRLKAATDAHEQRLLARIDALDEAEHPGVRWDRESVSTILRCAPVTARGRLANATILVTTLPLTLAALESGRITPGHARVMTEATYPLDATKAAALERAVLHRAETASVSEFRARCARAVLAVDPHGAERRHEQARRDRHVEIRPERDGMADVRAFITAEQAARVKQHLDACTDAAVKAAADHDDRSRDDRSRDEVRADVFCDLLAGGEQTVGARGLAKRRIEVTLAMSTLLGLDDLPGEVDGEPIAATIARRLASDPAAWWRPILVDRDGHVEALGARHYRPSVMLRRLVEVHDRYCRFPGCRRRAIRCETDHVEPFNHDDPSAGGLTEFENLHALCKRHHRLKHEGGWTVVRKDGISIWRSPEGRRYEKYFDPYFDPGESSSAGAGNPTDDPPPF